MSTGSRPAPRLRAVVRRRPELRHPDHRRAARAHRRSRCRFDYAAESDQVRYPLGTRHPDRGRPRLRRRPARDHRRQGHAAGSTRPTPPGVSNGRWQAGSGAVWSLKQQQAAPRRLDLRRRGRAADPARAAAVERGARRTGSTTRSGSPPTSPAGTTCGRPATTPARSDSLAYPPMGARFRLKAGLAAAGCRPDARSVVRGDEEATAWSWPTTARRGSSRASRTPSWPDRLIEDLKTIPASAFVAVDTSVAEGLRRTAPQVR